jgi:hypothetical protein
MSLTPFVTAANLRTALSPATYMALFDDEQNGDVDAVDASDAVQEILKDAHILTVSWLPLNYSTLPHSTDSDVSQLLKYAERQYAKFLAYDRHPEYVKVYGEETKIAGALKQAETTMGRVQSAIQQLADSPSMGKPANAGGVFTESGPRMVTDGADGIYNGGDL